MGSALMRGRTLEPKAVKEAKQWQTKRIRQLLNKDRTALSPKERGEARRLTKRWDFWNYTFKD